ncbi:MAG: redox-sensing transcriptional repressor Rex [Thermomicrobiaceae bacterium]
MSSPEIPDIVIRRLPIYLRTLRRMQDMGMESVSSEDLGAHIGVTAAQIRRDFSYFGRFGKQGKGYDIAILADGIQHVLKLDHCWDVALVGFGQLGRAIAHYRGFESNSFRISAIFARNPNHIGDQVNGVVVMDEAVMHEVIPELGIRIGIVAVPADNSQNVADRLVDSGVQAILNYAPAIIRVPSHVRVREIDPTSALQSLSFYLNSDGQPPDSVFDTSMLPGMTEPRG